MAQLTDLDKIRKTRLWNKRIKNFFFFLLFSGVIFAISLFVYHKGNLDLRTAVGNITAELTAGSGFPVSTPSGKLSSMGIVDSSLLVTTDSNLYTYNSTGRKLLDLQHGMITPTISIGGSRFLLYDRGGKKVMVFSRNSELYTSQSDFAVYDGDIARNGNFALVSGSDRFLSQVNVYNGDGKMFYQCFFGNRPAVAVGLDDARDGMAVGLLDVNNGDYLSTILRYQFDQKDASAEIQLPGELLLDLVCEDNGSVRVLTQSRAVLLDSQLREDASYPFNGKTMQHFRYTSEGKLLISLRESTGLKRNEIVLLDEQLKLLCALPSAEDLPQDLQVDSSHIYVRRDDALLIYDFTGKELARVQISGMNRFYPFNGLLYYSTSNELCTIPIKELIQANSTLTPNTAAGSSGASSGAASSQTGSDASSAPPSSSSTGWDTLREAILGTSSESAASSGASDGQSGDASLAATETDNTGADTSKASSASDTASSLTADDGTPSSSGTSITPKTLVPNNTNAVNTSSDSTQPAAGSEGGQDNH